MAVFLDWRETPMVSPFGGFFIQSRGGASGNFEVVVPWPDGGLAHFVRDNDEETTTGPVALAVHAGAFFAGWRTADARVNVARLSTGRTPDGLLAITGMDQKVVLSETTDAAPGLASAQGRLFVAWKGSGNNAMNVMFSADDGVNFGGKFTFAGESASAAPALAAHGPELVLAWLGSGNENINIASVLTLGTTTGGFRVGGLENKVTVPERTDTSPAVASAQGHLFLAWKGLGNDALNLAFRDGVSGGLAGKRVFTQTSKESPALAGSDGGGLVLAWRGSGNEALNVARVELFGSTAGAFGIEGLGATTTFDETSDAAPAVAAIDDELMIAWKGAGNPALSFGLARQAVLALHDKRVFGNAFRWSGPARFGTGSYAGATLIESDFRFDAERRLGNFEVLAVSADGELHHYWRDNSGFAWNGPFTLFTGYDPASAPSMMYPGADFDESNSLDPTQKHLPFTFFAVAARNSGGFDYLTFTSEPAGLQTPWTRADGADGPPTPAPNGLSVTARVNGNSAETGWKDATAWGSLWDGVVAAVTTDGTLHVWAAGEEGIIIGEAPNFGSGMTLFPEHAGRFGGRPCILQGDYGYSPVPAIPVVEIIHRGHYGDLELVVPDRTGGAFHFSRDCGTHLPGIIPIGSGWREQARLDGPIYDEISLLESTFTSGDQNNLELIGRRRGQRGFDAWWRDNNSVWHGPVVVGEPFQSDTDSQTERAHTMRALARELISNGQDSSALALLSSAAKLYQQLVIKDAARFVTEALETAGELTMLSVKLATAPGLASEAVDAQQSAVDVLLAVPPPHDGPHLTLLVTALSTLIQRLIAAQRAPEAFNPFEEAVTAYRELATIPATDLDATAQQLLDLSAVAAGATTTAPALVIPAVDTAQAALDILHTAHPDPHDAPHLANLAKTLRVLAQRLMADQRAPEARDAANKAVEAYTEAAALDPTFAAALTEAITFAANLNGE